MTPCKSCGTVARVHKLWCMRPRPSKPVNAHNLRAELLRMCA